MSDGGPAARPEPDFSAVFPLRYRAFVVVAVVALSPVVVVLGAHYYERTLKARLQGVVAEVVERGARGLRSGTGRDVLVRQLASDARSRVRVLDPGLSVLSEHDGSSTRAPWDRFASLLGAPDGPRALAELDGELSPLVDRPELARARREGRASGCSVLDMQRVLRCFAVSRLPDGRYLYAETARPRGAIALYALRYELLLVVLLVLPGALLLAWWLTWRMVRPIERLRAQVQRRARRLASDDDLAVERSDELGELASAFNELLRRLRQRSRQNEAFVADLAHEFKNPVAAIRAAAERLEQGDLTPDRVRRLSRVLEQSSARLDALLGQFLELASADAGMRGEQRAELSLARLVQGVVAQLQADERFASLTIEAQLDSDATLIAVESRLAAAVGNLLENAASFAGEGGRVVVRLRRGRAHLVLEVEDSGPGIAQQDLPRVFDRFFTRRKGGTGLGLALVRAVVEAHDGWVEARSEPGHGACFRLHLPLPARGAA